MMLDEPREAFVFSGAFSRAQSFNYAINLEAVDGFHLRRRAARSNTRPNTDIDRPPPPVCASRHFDARNQPRGIAVLAIIRS
jgi:hypothetical protein